MKDTLTDANFPRTADHRVYHLGLRPGEVANRIVTVGSPSRAETIAKLLDESPQPFRLSSERGFLTITGRYKGVPMSIVSIGMGSPNMDFFVREVRECISGDMAVIRLGSCGALINVPVGSVVVPKASVAVSRNVDFNFSDPESCTDPAYRISKPVAADPDLHREVHRALEAARPAGSDTNIVTGTVNASADSFYSSQGRQTSFPDHNENLIEQLSASSKDLATLEMETFHLFHLAACWGRHTPAGKPTPAPLTTNPVSPTVHQSASSNQPISQVLAGSDTVIKAAAAQLVFASRTSQAFITPEQVAELEAWSAKGVLEALKNTPMENNRLHLEEGSVWEYPTS
ncbi:hypothetical protein EYR40_002021 [Pleurotus pulmonarius]|nr:hypothetical protein EYR36_011580 [Pleurotus pulmonarius]KAF4585184.1 hypothetical protein EYR40_002021 [Pleurotus pulmonarius]KAF4607516.1 hypothetical protein EYR38_001588 [Pleurotus pulmonarius]